MGAGPPDRKLSKSPPSPPRPRTRQAMAGAGGFDGHAPPPRGRKEPHRDVLGRVPSDAGHGAVGLDRLKRSGITSGSLPPLPVTTVGGDSMGSAKDSAPDPRRTGSPVRPPMSVRPASPFGLGHHAIRPPPASRQGRSRGRSPSLRPATPCAIPSRPTSWRTDMTSGRFRSCSVIKMSRPRWFTPMF